jgi:hypothetical protein
MKIDNKTKGQECKISRLSVASLICTMCAPLILFIVSLEKTPPYEPSLFEMLMIPIALIFIVTSLVIAVVSGIRIHKSKGKLTGRLLVGITIFLCMMAVVMFVWLD